MAKKKKSKKNSLLKLRGHHPAAYAYVAVAIVAGAMFGMSQNIEAAAAAGKVNIIAATYACKWAGGEATSCKYYSSRSQVVVNSYEESPKLIAKQYCSDGKKTIHMTKANQSFVASSRIVRCTPGAYEFEMKNKQEIKRESGVTYAASKVVNIRKVDGKYPTQTARLGSSR